MRTLFVYGTLRGNTKGLPATIHGTLYNVGRFPAVVLGGEGVVHGEIFTASDDEIQTLDRYEGVSFDLYRRVPVTTQTQRRLVKAEVYVAGPVLEEKIADGSLPVIFSGDWFKRQENGQED